MTATRERPTNKKSYSSRRRVIEAIVIVAAATFLVFALSSIALLIYTEGSREPTSHTVDIPPGSFELIVQGENPLNIPPSWTFYADDTLILDNRDDVAHTLGNWVVPPNTIQAFELQPAYGGFFTCSLHPSGAITLNIQPRDYDFSIIALPTFGFGIALGLVIVIGLNVMRALDHNEDEWLSEAIDGSPIDKSAIDDMLDDLS
ncbi:MAG: hypothetical protein QNJ71_01830 [Acidimicrobiia bacterium]|nr:hypothetical protein [Acidimicrobiia bacterium]